MNKTCGLLQNKNILIIQLLMFSKVYLTSVFKRQYKYDLAMKWKKD